MRPKNKVFNYVVVLKQTNRRTVELIGLMAFSIFLIIILHQLITTDNHRIIFGLVALAGIGMFVGAVDDFRKRKKPALMLAFLTAAITLSVFLSLYWMTLFYLILALIYRKSTRPQEIGFSEDLILVNNIIPKKIHWSELNNVLIKDGLLTMDYKNNKIFQHETDDLDDDDDDEVTEEEFNAFCLAALKDNSN